MLLIFIGSVTLFWGQTGAGRIQGTVRDTRGAIIPSAKVTVTKKNTGEAFRTVTNSQGFYTVPGLFDGAYNVTVSAPGMSLWQGSVSLQVGQAVAIDADMTIATQSAQVTVVADQTTLLNTETATQATEVERQRIEQLPMNGRSIAGVLALATPGFDPGGSSNQPVVNGYNWGAFSWSMDGADISYRDGGGLDNVAPDPDAIQEVRVEVSNSSAKSDRPGTAIISTRSGTNSFHGSLFETNRDNGYGIARSRSDPANFRAPKLIRNEYGGTFGGPVFFPYFWGKPALYRGKNKAFFFATWEAMALRQNASANYYVPTDAMRRGDFSGLVNANGIPITLYDNQTTQPGSPWTRQPFHNNQIPISRISPLAKALYAVTPEPTNSGNPYQESNWSGVAINNQDDHHFTTRFDYDFTDKDRAFFRYTWGNSSATALGSNSTNYGAPTTDGVWNYWWHPLKSQSGALSWIHMFSPTFYGEFVAGMNYQSWNQKGEPNPNKDYTSEFGLQNLFGLPGLPVIMGGTTGNSTASILQSYGQGSSPWRDNDYTNTFDGNLTLIRGRHLMEFGGRYHHERLNILGQQSFPAQINFGGQGTAEYDPTTGTAYSPKPNTGLAAADFFLGDGQTYTSFLSSQYIYLREQEISSYFEDNFRIAPNLTLNLGVRWEILPALHEKNRQFTSFDFTNSAIITGLTTDELIAKGLTTQQLINGLSGIGVKFETPQQAGMPAGIFTNNFFNFLPRLGMAWQPLGTHRGLVLRGGYGEYMYPTPARNYYGAINASVPYTFTYSQNFASNAQNPAANNILRAPQTIIAGANSQNVVNLDAYNTLTPGVFGIQTLDSKQPPNYYDEWDVDLEKQLWKQTVASISYLGSHGGHLEQFWYTNTGPSSYVWYETTGQPILIGRYAETATRPYNKTVYGDINIQRKTGWSNSNSIQVNFQRLYHRGLAYQVSYVYLKSFRNGGNGVRDSKVYPVEDFVPGMLPSTDPVSLNRTQNYARDISPAVQRLRYNWVMDLPFGAGKRFGASAGKLWNQVIGGWQLAGDGTGFQKLWRPSTADWGSFQPLHYYGRKYKVNDCRGGVCRTAYLGYNGYLPTSLINTPKGVNGIPSSYQSAHQPLNIAQGNQNTTVKLANGSVVTTSYSPGPVGIHPYSHVAIGGPFNWTTDASLFKMFTFKEGVTLKLNADVFNVFNQQGTNYPDAESGMILTTSSFNTPRIIQLTARFNF